MSESGYCMLVLLNVPLSPSGWSSPDTEPETMQKAGERRRAHTGFLTDGHVYRSPSVTVKSVTDSALG